MDTENFAQEFAEVMNVEPDELTLEFRFPPNDEWESIAVISTIALVDEHFDVAIKAVEILQMQCLGDLYTLVESKQKG